MFAIGCASGIEEALLGNQHEGALGMLAVSYCAFAGADFFHCSPDMYSDGLQTLLCFPGNGAIQGVIDFKDAGTVAIVGKLLLIEARQAISGNAQKLAWGNITEVGASGRKHIERFDFQAGNDLAAERAQVIGHRIDDDMRAAVRGCSSGWMLCAASPAKSALARSPLKARSASTRAGSRAGRPKRMRARGCAGMRKGPRMLGTIFCQFATRGCIRRV